MPYLCISQNHRLLEKTRLQRLSLPSMTKPNRQPSRSTMGKIQVRHAGMMMQTQMAARRSLDIKGGT
eukprot:Skav226835  [mRNA]  locus=scaffold1741:81673:85244:+ [translate_table: standard]